MARRQWLTLVAMTIMYLLSLVTVARASTKSTSNGSIVSRLSGTKPDPFVQFAPLVVAMACRDGVAIVAAHPRLGGDEALLYAESDVDNDDKLRYSTDVESETENADSRAYSAFLDLPLSYEGPLRIQSIGAQGAALVSCGWGADGSGRMVDKARELCSLERQIYGEECHHILPRQLSLFMAECAVSDRKRSLSCASLVAFCGKVDRWRNSVESTSVSTTDSSHVGCLWLVDETGSYPVRAHCLGGGQTSGRDNRPVATVVNRRLLKLWRKQHLKDGSLPYFDVTTDEGLEMILKVLSSTSNEFDDSSDRQRLDPLLESKTRLELALVDTTNQRMLRRRVCDIRKKTLYSRT